MTATEQEVYNEIKANYEKRIRELEKDNEELKELISANCGVSKSDVEIVVEAIKKSDNKQK